MYLWNEIGKFCRFPIDSRTFFELVHASLAQHFTIVNIENYMEIDSVCCALKILNVPSQQANNQEANNLCCYYIYILFISVIHFVYFYFVFKSWVRLRISALESSQEEEEFCFLVQAEKTNILKLIIII